MNMDMTIDIDLNEVEKFIKSDNFIQFMMNNTTNIGIPSFILQTILDKIDELRKEND